MTLVRPDQQEPALGHGAEGPRKPLVPRLGPWGFARWMWRQLTSMRTALILLFLLAIAAIPGSLIPQTPVDPSAVVAFQRRHPELTTMFDRVGMFHVYSSVWFSAVYLLLMVSLVGCIIPRLQLYAKACRSRPPRAPRNLSRLSAYQVWEATSPRVVEVQRAHQLLAGQRRRIQIYESDAETVVSAEKGYLREAGNLLFHCAVVVVLIGVAVTGLLGFKGSAAVIEGAGFTNTLTQYDQFTPGARFNTQNLAPFSFTVTSFDMTWVRSAEARGAPASFSAHLQVTAQPGAASYDYDLQVNHPLSVDGTQVFLIGHGYAPDVTIRDGRGTVVASGPVVFLPQDGSFTSFGVIKAPDAKPTQLGFEGYFFPTGAVTARLQPYSAFPWLGNPVLSLVAYRGDLGLNDGLPQSLYVLDKTHLTMLRNTAGKPRAILLRPGQTASLGKGVGSITFTGVTPWVQLQVSREPGKLIPLVGVLLVILGLLASLFIRPRRTWVRLRDRPGGTAIEVAALDRVPGGDPHAYITQVAQALRPAIQTEEPP